MTKPPTRISVVFLDANVMLSASLSTASFVAEVLRSPSPVKFLTCTYVVDEVRRNLQAATLADMRIMTPREFLNCSLAGGPLKTKRG